MVLALPVLQLVLFAYAINTVVDHLPTVVLDESRSPDSRAFVAAFQNSGYFDVREQADSRADAAGAIDAGRAKVALVIPPDFGRRRLRGEPAPAQVLVDGSDPNTAQTALFAAGSVAQARGAAPAGARPAAGRAPAGGGAGGGIDLRPVVLYNPSMLSVN